MNSINYKKLLKAIFTLIFIVLTFIKLFTVTLTSSVSDISKLGALPKPTLTSNTIIDKDIENYIKENNITVLNEGGLDYFYLFDFLYTLWWILLIILILYLIMSKVKSIK
ncbi:hypothetical protein [Clostridium chrysemydis]|uniref:hypothetical protein n=1 Tax=Clostridium chrysemydis TaxID=2665504 RepID=UPI001883DF32|nr:hypothetical protein [Clostridium chrysemydis]